MKMRKENELDLERDMICYMDLILADSEVSNDEDMMVTECLAAFLNLSLPTAAGTISGICHII